MAVPARALRTAAAASMSAVALLAATGPAQATPHRSVPAGQVLRVETGAANVTVFGNLTVTQPEAAGHATAYPCNAKKPFASNLNFTAGQTVANFTAVRTDARGGFCVFTTAGAQFVFDMVATTPGKVAGTPQREYDSRDRRYAAKKPAAGQVVTITTDAPNATVFGTLTVTNPAAGGYATAYPCGAEPPKASNVNFTAGKTVAAFIGVRTDADGKFCVVSSSSADFVFDKVGSTTKVLSERPLRLIDTRGTFGAVPAGQIVHVATGSPSSTVMGTLTITQPAAAGYATAFSCDRPRPLASNLNFTAGQTVANFVTVRTDAAGDFCVFVSQTAQVIFDKVSANKTDIPAGDPERKLDSRQGGWQTEQEFEDEHGTETEVDD